MVVSECLEKLSANFSTVDFRVVSSYFWTKQSKTLTSAPLLLLNRRKKSSMDSLLVESFSFEYIYKNAPFTLRSSAKSCCGDRNILRNPSYQAPSSRASRHSAQTVLPIFVMESRTIRRKIGGLISSLAAVEDHDFEATLEESRRNGSKLLSFPVPILVRSVEISMVEIHGGVRIRDGALELTWFNFRSS